MFVPGCYHELVHDIWRLMTYHENDAETRLTRISSAAGDSWRSQVVIWRSLSSYHRHHRTNSQPALKEFNATPQWLLSQAASSWSWSAALSMLGCNLMSSEHSGVSDSERISLPHAPRYTYSMNALRTRQRFRLIASDNIFKLATLTHNTLCSTQPAYVHSFLN